MQICKALIDNSTRICKAKLNDDEVMITTDGYTAFVLFEKECVFDLNKIPTKDELAKFIKTDDSYEEVFVAKTRFVDRGFDIAKLQGSACTVYANEKYIKCFNKCRLFASKDKLSVIAKNDLGMTVGMFCPMRFSESTL